MKSKIYKKRRLDQKQADQAFESTFRYKIPSEWTVSETCQIFHIVKWSSVSFNLGKAVELSKTLLIRELGQRGYVNHINKVYPLIQGHNLGKGQITVYDYRGLFRKLARWIEDQGSIAIDEFKSFLKKSLGLIQEHFGKKMGWFFKKVSFWLNPFKTMVKQLTIEKKTTVTTILESYNSSKSNGEFPSAMKPAIGKLAFKTLADDPYLTDFLQRCGLIPRKTDEAPSHELPSSSSA